MVSQIHNVSAYHNTNLLVCSSSDRMNHKKYNEIPMKGRDPVHKCSLYYDAVLVLLFCFNDYLISIYEGLHDNNLSSTRQSSFGFLDQHSAYLYHRFKNTYLSNRVYYIFCIILKLFTRWAPVCQYSTEKNAVISGREFVM